MPSNTHKSAAVPFVNQKGERSMKRVKVERYIAGKKPTYAKDDEDEEEYYTTDEEDEEQEFDGEEEGEDDDDEYHESSFSKTTRRLEYCKQDDDDDDEEEESGDSEKKSAAAHAVDNNEKDGHHHHHNHLDDDEDDDPRFRRLKQIESRAADVSHLIDVQRTHQIQPKYEQRKIVIDEDDDEDEIRQRHMQAKRRQLEAPLGPRAVQDLIANEGGDEDEDDQLDQDGSVKQSKRRLDTDDLLKDLKLTGITRSVREQPKSDEELEAEKRRLRELEHAKQVETFTKQTQQKVDEDIKRDKELEALAKVDRGSNIVITDDEDDELAYEEWKLREIERVLRFRKRAATAASR